MNKVSGAAAALSGDGLHSGVSSVISSASCQAFLHKGAPSRKAAAHLPPGGAIAATQRLEMARLSGKPESSEGGNRLRAGGKIFGRGENPVAGTVLRRGVLVLGIAALAVAALLVALPFIASNRIVRDRIALEMSAWSGYRVSIGAAPDIRIWPDFGAVLTEVSLTPRDSPDGQPVIEAERVEVELSPLAALRGDVVFSTARLVRPILRLRKTSSGTFMPVPPGGGRIAASIDTARRVVAESPGAPDHGSLPADVFGKVEFLDGTILAGDAAIVTGLAGKVEWPALNRPGSAKAEGMWRGEDGHAGHCLVEPAAPLRRRRGGRVGGAAVGAGELPFRGHRHIGKRAVLRGPGQVSRSLAAALSRMVGCGKPRARRQRGRSASRAASRGMRSSCASRTPPFS